MIAGKTATMWILTVCFTAICVLVPVKASPDITLDDLLERLITLEDWKRETEKEVTTLRETVVQQGLLIKNLERELEIQANKTASILSSKPDVNQDTHGHNVYTEDDSGSDGQISNTQINDLDKPAPVRSSIRNKREIVGGVAFTAYLDHDINPGSQQTIAFNQIITNDGNAYNSNTGVFTCPEAGMYLFSFHMAERSQTAIGRQLYTELRVNSQPLVGAVAETDHTYDDDQGGNTVLIRLQQGDAVWVDVLKMGADHVEGNNSRFSTFSGVYLYA